MSRPIKAQVLLAKIITASQDFDYLVVAIKQVSNVEQKYKKKRLNGHPDLF